MTDSATLDIVDNLSVGNWSPQNRLTIDGAFCTNKTLVVGESLSAASNRVLLVNGGVLVCKESVIIGEYAPDNELVVSNGVEFANDLNKNVVVGQYETSTGNRVLIDSPAKLSFGLLYFGYNSSSNVMKVRNVGAPFSREIWVGRNDFCSSDNYFEWDDSFTATGAYPVQFGAGATNCVARLKGISWKKIGTSTDFSIQGARNVFEFVNGSMWTIAALSVSYGGRLSMARDSNRNWSLRPPGGMSSPITIASRKARTAASSCRSSWRRAAACGCASVRRRRPGRSKSCSARWMKNCRRQPCYSMAVPRVRPGL